MIPRAESVLVAIATVNDRVVTGSGRGARKVDHTPPVCAAVQDASCHARRHRRMDSTIRTSPKTPTAARQDRRTDGRHSRPAVGSSALLATAQYLRADIALDTPWRFHGGVPRSRGASTHLGGLTGWVPRLPIANTEAPPLTLALHCEIEGPDGFPTPLPTKVHRRHRQVWIVVGVEMHSLQLDAVAAVGLEVCPNELDRAGSGQSKTRNTGIRVGA